MVVRDGKREEDKEELLSFGAEEEIPHGERAMIG